MSKPPFIRVIAICVFRIAERILVFEAFDSVKETPFYRPLGGGVEPGETTQEAIAREIGEELGQEITDLVLLGVIENLFTVEQRVGHEIVFVYDGRFVDETIYAQEYLTVVEDNGEVLRARWRQLSFFDAYHRLVPPELFEVLGNGD